jgi:hypothetical protein
MNAEQINRMFRLFEAVREGIVSEEQLAELDQILAENKEACHYYLEYFNMCVLLKSGKAFDQTFSVIPEMNDSLRDMGFWQAMAREEQTAPGMEIPAVPEEVSQEKILTAIRTPQPKVSKLSLFSLFLSSAVLIFMIVYAHLVSLKRGIEVATLADSIDAVWDRPASSMQAGSRLTTDHTRYLLRAGLAKLLFDNSVEVLIEAPSQFRLLSQDKVELVYGRIYAKVPPQAVGFTIDTLSAQIVDWGTEFGVEVDYKGDTSLHVMKGKTLLVVGNQSKQSALPIEAGTAKKVSATTNTVSDVPCDHDRFIRDLDSSNNFVWRGEVKRWDGYVNWTAESGNWADGANWDTGIKPDGSRCVRLRKGPTSVCTLNTVEKPISSVLIVSNGQTLTIEEGGYMGCGWSRFGGSTVYMRGNGTWLLNNDDLYIGYPEKGAGECVWTMYDHSKIEINDDQDDGEVLYISQDNAKGTLRLVGSNVSIRCDQLYVGYPRNPGFSPVAVLEYVMDANGAGIIRVGYRVYLAEETASSYLLLRAPEPLPKKDIVLIEILGNEKKIRGKGAFTAMNGGPAAEGTPVQLGGNLYTLTYRYEANGDGYLNDIALVFQTDSP